MSSVCRTHTPLCLQMFSPRGPAVRGGDGGGVVRGGFGVGGHCVEARDERAREGATQTRR